MKCDFCSGPEVAWRYPAQSFIGYAVGNVIGESVGDWAACEPCHRLIEAGDPNALAERCISTFIDGQPELQEFRFELTASMKDLHTRFFRSRLGDATPAPRECGRTGHQESVPV